MSLFRWLGLCLTFGLLGGLVRAADEPAQKKADDAAKTTAKLPSDAKQSTEKGPLSPDDEYYELFRSFAARFPWRSPGKSSTSWKSWSSS